MKLSEHFILHVLQGTGAVCISPDNDTDIGLYSELQKVVSHQTRPTVLLWEYHCCYTSELLFTSLSESIRSLNSCPTGSFQVSNFNVLLKKKKKKRKKLLTVDGSGWEVAAIILQGVLGATKRMERAR